jgi:hypothetical protein
VTTAAPKTAQHATASRTLRFAIRDTADIEMLAATASASIGRTNAYGKVA